MPLVIFITYSINLPLFSQSNKLIQEYLVKKDYSVLVELLYTKPNVQSYQPKADTNGIDILPYGEVFRTGGRDYYKITFSEKVLFGDKQVRAGSYFMSFIPNQTEWKVLLSPAGKISVGDYALTQVKAMHSISVPIETSTSSISNNKELKMSLISKSTTGLSSFYFEYENLSFNVSIKNSSKASVNFPWKKIPIPSTKQQLDKASNLKFGKTYSLGNIDSILTHAIKNAGYDDQSYFYKDNDFVFITQLEQIKDTGEPQEDLYRWIQDVPPIQEFTLTSIIKVKAPLT